MRTIGSARATKLWRWNPQLQQWAKVSYQAGAWFRPTEHEIGSLDELVRVLDVVRRDPTAFVVRGALAPDYRAAIKVDPHCTIRRRKHLKGGVDPSLVEVARRWLMIDIDGWPLPPWADLADDPETAIDEAVHQLLPPEFHDVRCWWQLSSSAGFSTNTLKVHLFFWLSAPAENAHIKRVLKQQAPGVDTAPFNAAQPHYIADPIIEGGHDPMPRRTGWRQGADDQVVLPPPKADEPRARTTGTDSGRSAGGDVEDALASLGHGEGGEGFHAPLRLATLRYARRVIRFGGRDDETLKEELRVRIREAPVRPGSDSVETPYCQDFYLDSLIKGAFALLAADPDVQTMRPHHAPASMSLEEARRELGTQVAGFFQRAAAWNAVPDNDRAEDDLPEHAALIVGVGIGKSTAARAELPAFIAAAKAAGRAHRVLWLVPHHRLSNEAGALMRGMGIDAVIWRGRDADDPSTIDLEAENPPQKMCLNPEAVADAITIGHKIETSVCGSPKDGKPRCPWRVGEGRCGYQKQKAPAARADVVIAAHHSMFHELPKEISAGLAVVVVDESWWQVGLAPNKDVKLAGFAEEPITYPVLTREKLGKNSFRYVRLDLSTNELHDYSARAMAVFGAMRDGEFASKAAFLVGGLSADDCAAAHKLEWQRKMEGAIYPGQSPENRAKMVEMAIGNAGIPRRAGIWSALGELLQGEETHTGRLQVVSRTDKEGAYRVIVLHSRLEVQEDVGALPILALDATMPLAAVQRYLPRLKVLAEVQAATPHLKVHQVIGGWGKTSLVPHPRASEQENGRRKGLVRELADFVALNGSGNALAVTYLAIEQQFDGLPGVRSGHFNAMAGLDAYGDVRTLFVIGRPLPDPRDLRTTALALTGRAIPDEVAHTETRGALMADGTGAAVNVRVYADPDLEALRTAVAEAEVIQIAGRGRAVNRTAETPLDLVIMADVVIPLPVNRLVRWHDIRPGVIARMLARGAVLFGPTDAAKAYPDLFPTPEAARKAMARTEERTDFPDISLRDVIFLGDCPENTLFRLVYRPQGRGQQNRTALVTEGWLVGGRAWLEGLLGPLSVFEVTESPPPPPSPSAPKPEPPHAPVAPEPGEPPPWEDMEDVDHTAEVDGWWGSRDGKEPGAFPEAWRTSDIGNPISEPAGG